MRVCKYPNCSHTTKCNNGCKMHKFPISRDKCLMWLAACGLETTPSKIPAQFYLCSCHFIDGEGPRENGFPVRMEEMSCESVQDTSLLLLVYLHSYLFLFRSFLQCGKESDGTDEDEYPANDENLKDCQPPSKTVSESSKCLSLHISVLLVLIYTAPFTAVP